MNKKEAEKKQITIYWWNMGSKTLDFDGTVKDYLEKRCIGVSRISHKIHKDIKGYRFRISLYSCSVTLDKFGSDYAECVNDAIRIFLMLMGDKTIYNSPYGREYKINWR